MASLAPKIIVTNRFPANGGAPTKFSVCKSVNAKIIVTNRFHANGGAPTKLSVCKSVNGGLLVYPKKLMGKRLRAVGITEVEPDLVEEKQDRWETNSISGEDFKYGEYDDHHTYFEGQEEKMSFWEAVKYDYQAAEPPTGFQGLMSWLFLPAVLAGMVYHVQGEYLYIGAAVFVAIFCGIEMGKPDKPHNFEPQIYNMERGARDKLIADYNTMDIWDFNEKYGDLWDFTLEHEKQ